jgi:hypothetical protein
LGRWTQPDPNIPQAQQGTQAWDRYTYVSNNPIRFLDPTGKYGVDVHQTATFMIAYGLAYNMAKSHDFTDKQAEQFATNLATDISKADQSADSKTDPDK